MSAPEPGPRRWPVVGLLVIAVAATLYVAKAVFAPILVALLLKLVLAPPVRWLRRLGVPAAVAAGLVVLGALGCAGAGIYWISGEVSSWSAEAPERVEELQHKLDSWRGKVAEVGRTMDEVNGSASEGTLRVRVARGDTLTTLLDTTWQALASLVVVGFLLFFLLASEDVFLRRLVEALPRLRDKRLAVTSVREIESRVSRYLVTVTLINTGLGLTVGLAMAALEMPNPVLWGVMAGLLNFVPYAGFVIGVAIVGLVSVASFDGVAHMALPPAVYLVLNGIEGYLITPFLIGRGLSLNPTAVFVSVLVWGFLWGVVGVLLAVPLLITARVILEASDRTRAVGSFLAS